MTNTVASSKENFRVDWLLVSLITLVGTLLRLPTLKMGLWLDEFISIYLATRPTFQETYDLLWRGMEFNPPLNHLLMRLYLGAAGTGEIVVRLPSFLWGVLLMPAMYWLGTTIHSRKAGLLAALFAALSTQANYFTCQTRPYSISTLLNCLCIIYFCRLLAPREANEKSEKAASVKPDLIIFTILMTLFCYASTFGVFSLAVFMVAYAVLWLSRRFKAGASETDGVNLSLRVFAPALILPGVFVLPWLPTMVHQAKIIKPVDPCNIAELPWSFGVCLTTMLPTPLLLSIWVAEGAAILFAGLLVYWAVKGQLKNKFVWLKETLLQNPSYLVICLMTLLPSAIMGIFAGVWLGYFRYIYPFSPAEWMLLALLILGSDKTFAARKNEKKTWRTALGILALILLCGVNGVYTFWFAQKSQSGLKLVAEAIREGKFDNSVILLAPDLPGPSLYYYSKEAERAAHHVEIKGFVREHPDSPTIGDTMSEQWSSQTVVDDYVAKVEKCARDGYQYLAFAQDSLIYGTDKIPLKPRVYGLFDKLKGKYKVVKTDTYPGVTETMNVTFFKLN